jgi:predicted lipoprotein with Yx(FWY)xxD motif
MRNTFVLLALLASAAAQAAGPAVPRNGVLADGKGRTLYVFTKDTPNASQCHDACAKAWPPFLVADATKAGGSFSIVNRKDGTQQWAHHGQPLYYYAGDGTAGEQTGEGSGGVWFVVRDKPAARAPASQASEYRY